MEDRLITLLSGRFGYPVRRQGSLSSDEPYPSDFFTFWNDSSEDLSHYDNDAVSYTWRFSIYFYSTNPDHVYTVPLEAIEALKEEGWIINGRGYDVPSDEITHTGRAFDCIYIERPGTN